MTKVNRPTPNFYCVNPKICLSSSLKSSANLFFKWPKHKSFFFFTKRLKTAPCICVKMGSGAIKKMRCYFPLHINRDYHLSQQFPASPSPQIKGFQEPSLQKTKVLIYCIVSKGNRWFRHAFALALLKAGTACRGHSGLLLHSCVLLGATSRIGFTQE